jgi:RNA-binding protein YhbY
VTRVVRKAQDVDLSDLATRTDLSAIKADLEKSIAENKAEILKWMVGSIGFQTVVIIGALLALTRSVPH